LASGKLIYNISGSEFFLGLVAAVFGIGTIIINFLGGVIADRLEKKILMIITSFCSSLILIILAIVDNLNLETVSIVIILSTILGLISGFDWPVRSSIFTQFLDNKEQIVSAVSLNAILWQGVRIIAPGIGGFIIAFYGTQTIFYMSAVGFFIMGIIMIRIKPNKNLYVIEIKNSAKNSIFQETLEGIKYIYENKIFRIIILATYLTSFFGMSYLQLLPSFADSYKLTTSGDVSAQILGILLSSAGIGAVFGTIITSNLKNKINIGKLAFSANVISVIFLLLFGISNFFINENNIYSNPWISYNLLLSLLFSFLSSTFSAIFMVCSMSILQLNVPDKLRGRVMGIHTITFSLLSVGALILGLLAEFFGSSIAVMISSTLLIIINLYIFISKKEIRNI
jgi:MFS family permease